MKEATEKLLEKFARAIETARRTLAIPDTEAAVARAYYAMFYAAEALLFMPPSVSTSPSLEFWTRNITIGSWLRLKSVLSRTTRSIKRSSPKKSQRRFAALTSSSK